MTPNQTKAERIIVEILRQAKGGLNKTKLYKTFWIAHLFYAKENRGYLSDWPIVKMPNGPGIDNGDRILKKLSDQGEITITTVQSGPFQEFICRITGHPDLGLSPEAQIAIAKAVEFTASRTATELSDLSHEHSRGWRERESGEEIDIYADMLSDEDIERARHEVPLAVQSYRELFE